MRQKKLLMIALLCTIVQGVWAWDGSGTSADPYKIKNSADWKQLADDVTGGNSFSGQYFEMTADVDAQGISVGSESKPFSGTFSGGMFTLTYNAGTIGYYREGLHAPFVLLKGAAIKDLKVAGEIYSKSKYSAGLACFVDGAKTTTVSGCHVTTRINGSYDVNDDANFGGFVAFVKSTSSNPLSFKDCSFQGLLGDFTAGSACFVGFTRVPISIEHCMVDPITVYQGVSNTATFVRATDDVTCALKECYYTQAYGKEQGQGVFKSVKVPDGCKAEMVSQPMLTFNGVDYYGPGTQVNLTVPEGTPFDHWVTSGKPIGCFISDPWTADGIHTISDIRTQPQLSIATSMPEPYQSNRERYGINYRYLTDKDYLLFMSDSLRQARGYRFNNKGECFVYDVDGTMTYITVVWNCNPNSEVFQNFFRDGWFQDKDYEGCIIDNDLVSDGWEHTHLFAIAPRAFLNVKQLKRIVFKSDIDPTFRGNAVIPLEVIIQEQAFKDSGIEELVMMYRNEKTEQWEVLGPTSGVTVAANAFEGTSAQIAVDPSVYQSYLADKNWSAHSSRFSIYAAKVEDMSVNGAVYSYMRNTKGEPLKNSNSDHATLMETLRYWNADYQEFTASSLLSTRDDQNIWYASVVGCDDSYLKSNDGTMRIYNDPGSYYNYKTIVIGRNAFKDSKELKHIEFWQTNGRSENSLNDLKMVIQNGAFKGCSNLKELRMFYYVQDGDDHWEVLGPENVIPGDNIFGIPYDEMDNANLDEQKRLYEEAIPADFKIIVSPDRYQDFINDPNWMVYQEFIEPSEFNPNSSDMKDFSLNGLTYGYMTSPGGIMQTSQTVSQDVSWWTAPRIAIELALEIWSVGSAISSFKAAQAALVSQTNTIAALQALTPTTWEAMNKLPTVDLMNNFMASGVEQVLPEVLQKGGKHVSDLVNLGFITEAVSQQGVVTRVMKSGDGLIQAFNQYILLRSGGRPGEGLVNTVAFSANLNFIHLANTAIGILQKRVSSTLAKNIANFPLAAAACGLATTSSYFSSKCWGGTGSYDGDALQKGMKANILSNMHQVSLAGGGYVITTPQKNLCYHTYIKDVPASTTDAVIYAGTGKGQGRNNNARTMTMAKTAFRDHTSLKTVKFHETGVQSDEAMPMLFTIPDSAFVGCTNLESLDLRAQTESNGQQALGPESFILGGDSIFAGLDPAKFHIIIDPKRKQDFLDNESWKPLEQYFVYEEAQPKTQYQEYGGNYAYAYENGTTQKVNKVSGHKIEHTVVTGADNEFLSGHQGALKLCNDIGVWNNYQLDAVTKKAFMGNQSLRVVNFTDLMGTGAYGTSYTGLQVALMDSCFADCKNLANLDLLYLVTDGDNHIDPIRPEQVTIGKGVLDGTTAKIKMMPQQVQWFEADTTWNKYKDRFMACIIKPGDEGIRKALKPMAYYDMAHTGYDPTTWDEYIDLARIGGAGFSWLDGKFREQSDDIRSFSEFKHFENVGLDYVGKEWFRGCKNLSNIVLPKTIKTLQEYAFASCFKLEEIELPAALTEVGSHAFADCRGLKTIHVLGTTPANLTGTDHFQKNEGLKIYVPAGSVDAYKTAWAEYKDYIVSNADYKVVNEVTLTNAGTLAEKLGLYVEWSYSGGAAYDEPRYIHGNYAKFDSLVVHGPLNDLDLWTIRYLTGNNGYDRGGVATDGNLRYLNLYDTRIVKDDNKAHYLNKSWGIKWAWEAIQNENELPYNLFFNCTSLESLVLPKTLTKINARIFEGCSALKRLAIPASLQDYDTWEYFKGLLDYPLEELVFVTDKPAVSDRNNPWGQEISVAYTKKSQLSDYMNQPYLTRSAQAVVSLFEDDAVMETLAQNGQFFPSEYLQKESIGNIFRGNDKIVSFKEFNLFTEVKELEPGAFFNCNNLKDISLPDSLERIARTTFSGCRRLDTIYISTEKVPELAEKAFADLPDDFRILVPKNLCKLYREKWAEYADHINVDEQNYSDNEWTVVTLDKPNTLAEKLGFEVNWDYRRMTVFSTKHNYINGVRGDYSKIHKLKVNGPISGSDFAFMRYLAGFCPWSNSRNAMGQLEAIDLYDADIKASDDLSAPDMFKVITHMGPSNVEADNELPSYAFLQAYNLKSLVLPKTCTKINTRALQQCEALETLVLGDDLVDFDWSALDDDVMLTRLYIMAKQKPEMTQDNWLVRQLYNNYNPTFDAFYVRPSLYNDYLSDRAYTHDLQRTNLISKGVFDDDDSFCAFARHAAATQDDLGGITDVKGWFDNYAAARNLTPLKYTAIDTLKAATMAPLTQLEQVALPKTLKDIEQNAFQKNTKLRYVDMLLSNDADLMNLLHNVVHSYLGLNEQMTLAYMPAEFGDIGETNVVVSKDGQLKAYEYSLIDSLDYMVPYAFEAISIKNSRKLAASQKPYSMCLPYAISLPQGSMAYKLSWRDANTLVFEEETSTTLEALHPYLVMVNGDNGAQGKENYLSLDSYKFEAPQPIPASTGIRIIQDDAPGYSIRGTLKGISNAEAADLGAYILQSDGKWHPVSTANAKASILPFRAYLLPSTHSNGARAVSMSLVNADGTTAIDTIRTIDADGTERYYDLNGRRIDSHTAKGVVIENGKKVIRK
jgi:hypothetical protein